MAWTTDQITNGLMRLIFPNMPDFYALIDEQCQLLVRMATLFEEMMTHDGQLLASNGELIRELEHTGDRLVEYNITTLRGAFNTPIDREDIYRIIVSIDVMLDYAKTTVDALEVFRIEPDAAMGKIATLLREGMETLRDGYRQLAIAPTFADTQAKRVFKIERQVEQCYREALARLFDPWQQADKITATAVEDPAQAVLATVMNSLKYRELYRHLSNMTDHLHDAGRILQDIAVQIS